MSAAKSKRVAVYMEMGPIVKVRRINNQQMDFKNGEELSKFIASTNELEGSNRLSVFLQALGWLGDRVTSILSDLALSEDDSPNNIATIENVLQFYADAWANGDIDLSKDDSGLSAAPQAQPQTTEAVAQGAKGQKITTLKHGGMRVTYSQQQRVRGQKLSYGAIKNQLRLRGHTF
jgi:hypothetical protein